MKNASQGDTLILDQLSRFIGGRKSPQHIQYNGHQAFCNIDVTGKSVLEVGAGEGLLSAYAAAHGAKYVVALEPEAAGSTDGYAAAISRMNEVLNLSNLEIVSETLQSYNSGGRRFDIVLLWNSVNHLDEPMCELLLSNSEARDAYRSVFRCLARMMTPSARLIIADCSRYNVYPILGIRNPITPQIEWRKHHSPNTWIRLLEPLGFVKGHLSWTVPYPLRTISPLLSNSLAAFFVVSHFRLVMNYRD